MFAQITFTSGGVGEQSPVLDERRGRLLLVVD